MLQSMKKDTKAPPRAPKRAMVNVATAKTTAMEMATRLAQQQMRVAVAAVMAAAASVVLLPVAIDALTMPSCSADRRAEHAPGLGRGGAWVLADAPRGRDRDERAPRRADRLVRARDVPSAETDAKFSVVGHQHAEGVFGGGCGGVVPAEFGGEVTVVVLDHENSEFF